MPEYTKGGNLGITGLNVPDNPRPGEAKKIIVDVENTAAFIGPFDDDKCIKNATKGYDVDIIVELPDGSQRPTNTCLLKGGIATNAITIEEPFTVPSTEGEYTVRAKLELEGSGKSTAWVEEAVMVTRDPAEAPAVDDENDSSVEYPWTGDGNNNPGDGGNPLDDLTPDVGQELQGIGLLIVLLIGVYLLVQLPESGAEVASPI